VFTDLSLPDDEIVGVFALIDFFGIKMQLRPSALAAGVVMGLRPRKGESRKAFRSRIRESVVRRVY
jgi:hypothetical protein